MKKERAQYAHLDSKNYFFNYFVFFYIKVWKKEKNLGSCNIYCLLIPGAGTLYENLEKTQLTVRWPQVKSETLLESYNESFLCWGVFEKHALSFCIACSFIHCTLFIHYFICADKWTRILLLYLKYIDCAFLYSLLHSEIWSVTRQAYFAPK